jgi:nucleotide-binding universal stress UspA family protein
LEECNPQKGILDTAKKIKGDLIVIGSNGLSKVKKFLLGSVSHSVIKRVNADIPVLVVKMRSLALISVVLY